VKPISGRPLSATHSAEIERIWSVIAYGASAYVHHSAVMPALAALFNAVRTSCHFLPVKLSWSSSIIVSSATCTADHPSFSTAARVSAPTL